MNENIFEQYASSFPPEAQKTLREVYAIVNACLPNATLKMSYGMPTFWQGENIIHIAAFKNHVGFFCGGEAVKVFADVLTGYKTSKGSVTLPFSQDVDEQLIKDITLWRLKQATSGKRTFAEPKRREAQEMPDFIISALENENLFEQYNNRPPYQQRDYISWIVGGKRDETKRKRLLRMIEELKKGGVYMGMRMEN